MKRVARSLALALALSPGLPGGWLRGADAPVQLPPMLVEESISSVPWLYANAGGTEFLSRCSASTTRELAAAWLSKLQLIRALVPEEYQPQMDASSVFVLYAQDLKQTMSAEIQRELQGDPAGGDSVNVAPNMQLSDRDMHASITYIDEALFDPSNLSISPAYVRYLLQRHVPAFPDWVLNGVERTVRRADFLSEPVTLRPLVWIDSTESDDLAGDSGAPRAILPAVQLFATAAGRGAETRHLLHVRARAATEELFFQWALEAGPAMRAAYWKFASLAATQTATEEMFENCFGFDYAELRDRLSDYLPDAVSQSLRLDPGKLPPLPRIDVADATPDQVARVRGEWERLAIGYVRQRLPRVREPYIAQARRTLHRAYDAGDRDPRLLATMGLCEIDAGDDAGARAFLEPAVATGVIRPRAYYELARLRFAELRDKKNLTFGEIAPVIGPLEQGLKQAPPLPEACALLGEAWSRCPTPLTDRELAELTTVARLFRGQSSVAFPIARALARHGHAGEATAVLDACAETATDAHARAELARVRAELESISRAATTP